MSSIWNDDPGFGGGVSNCWWEELGRVSAFVSARNSVAADVDSGAVGTLVAIRTEPVLKQPTRVVAADELDACCVGLGTDRLRVHDSEVSCGRDKP